MNYTSKLLSLFTISVTSAACLSAATLVEFTFDNSGADIDERAGWQPSGGASLDPRVIIMPNESLFNDALGLSIAPEINVPVQIGMQQIAAPDAFAGNVNPGSNNPTNDSQAVTQIAAIGQFTIINDQAPDPPAAPAGWGIVPESVTLQATATNLSGVLLRDNFGDIAFAASPSVNGSVNITIPITNRGRIQFSDPVSYTLYLVGSSALGSPTALSFANADGDFLRYNGEVEAIPEPSVYMAGATALMLGGFLYVRRRKAAKAQENVA